MEIPRNEILRLKQVHKTFSSPVPVKMYEKQSCLGLILALILIKVYTYLVKFRFVLFYHNFRRNYAEMKGTCIWRSGMKELHFGGTLSTAIHVILENIQV